MNAPAIISTLPRDAARPLAVEILLAETLGDDILESCLYILRERLPTPQGNAAGKPANGS